MNRKTKSIILGGTAALAMLAASTPYIGQESAPAQSVRPVSMVTQEDKVFPAPKPMITPVGEKTAQPDTITTLPTEIDFEPPEPNDSLTISTPKEAPRDNPTPTPSQNTATITTTEPKMGDTRTMDGQKQVYFLGFGWIEDNDEPNVGIVVDGEGDINKMVGTM